MTPADLIRAMRRISMTVRRGKVNLVDDSGPVQTLQGDFGPIGPDGKSLGIRDKTRMVYVFGFSSSPPVDADVVLLAVGGDFANAVGIGTNHQPSRPTGLKPGESLQYDLWGNRIHLTQDGIIITDSTGNCTVTIDAAGMRIEGDNGNLDVAGNLTAGNGASGVITSPTGQTVTFQNGICTNIV
jgi:phage baseplate assembly protein V